MVKALSVGVTSPKPRVRSKTRHEDLLNEAARQLNRNGFSLTSLNDIATALKVSRRALYHYIEDREDLVYQCYVRSCDVAGRHLHAAIADGGDAVATIERLLDLMLAPEAPELCAISEPGLLPEPKRDDVERRYQAVVRRLAEVLKAGAKAGAIRRCDFEIAARSILGVVFWLPLADPWSTALPPRDVQIAFTKGFIFRGWAAEPRRLPAYERVDMTALAPRAVRGFDRQGLAEAKREQILAAASRLFNRKGIDATSLEEIGAALEVTTMALYHHVGNKQTLVAECYFRMMRMALRLQELAYGSQGGLTGLMAFHHAWALAQMHDDLSPLTPMTGFSGMSPEAQAQFRDYAVQLTDVSRQHIEAGVAAGELRPMDVNATRLNVGVTGWLARAAITDPDRQDAAAREAAAFIAVGIRALD